MNDDARPASGSDARTRRRTFLTADWLCLAMLNYRVDPHLLQPRRPAGTELDERNGQNWISLVGFLFRNTRVLSIPVPWHRHFEEVNLRFYVRRRVGGEIRRGVTFIRELVPRVAVAWTARLAFNEPYRTVRMSHRIDTTSPGSAPDRVQYGWHHTGRWNRLTLVPSGAPREIAPGSDEEFISERHWGYTTQRDGTTVEYEVEHPRWRIWRAGEAKLESDTRSLHAPAFAEVLRRPPDSAFLAAGSPVRVRAPVRLRA